MCLCLCLCVAVAEDEEEDDNNDDDECTYNMQMLIEIRKKELKNPEKHQDAPELLKK